MTKLVYIIKQNFHSTFTIGISIVIITIILTLSLRKPLDIVKSPLMEVKRKKMLVDG